MSTLQVNRIIPLTGSSVYIEGGTFESASYVNPLIQNVFITGALSTTGVITSNNSLVVTETTFTPFSSSVSSRVSSLESWSSSLDLVYATDAQLNASASALQAGVTSSVSVLSSSLATPIAQNAATASSLTTASASFSTRVTTIEDQYATTGSNTFIGTNSFNILSASYIYAQSASIDYLSVVYQTSSIVYSTGSNQLGDSAGDTQTLWGTVNIVTGPVHVTGSLLATQSITASQFLGSGSSQFGLLPGDSTTFYGTVDIKNGPVLVTGSLKVAQDITASNLTVQYGIIGNLTGTATTASYVEFAQTASYVANAQNANTASYVTLAQTASYVANAQTASFVQQAQNAYTASYVNYAQTASLAEVALTAFTASYIQTAQTASYVAFAQSASYVALAQSASYVEFAQSASYVATAQNANTASYVETARSASYVQNAQTASYVQQAQNAYTASYVDFAQTASLALTAQTSNTASYITLAQTASYVLTAQTASYVSLAQTASYVLTAQTASYVNLAQSASLASTAALADTAINAPYYVTTASYTTDSSSFSTRVSGLESWSSSLNISSYATDTELNVSSSALQAGVTSSISVATTNLQTGVTASIDIATGSLQAGVTASIAIATGSLQTGVTASINALSSSVAPQIANLQITASVLTSASASFASASGSLSTRTTNLESTASNLTTASSSFSTRVSTIEGNYATTGSNTFLGTQYISDTTNPTTFTSTAALYTDGGLRVTKDSYVSGGLYVAGNLTVYGTSSISYVTTSVFVGLEYINLNTELPALRYAGINVGDSGSAAGISSSFWYDSEKDNWLYVHAHQGADQTSSLAINGPITYNNLGNEQGLTANYITKAQLINGDPTNNHHITSSQIYDDGTTVAIAGNLQVTGSLRAANLTGSLNGSNLVAGSVGNDRLTNSAITIAGTSTSLGGSISAATILSGTGVFSGSAQIPNLSITNAQLANQSVTVNTSTGLSGGGSLTLGNSLTLTNTGVISLAAGTGVSLTATSGQNCGISIGQAVNTNSSVSFANITSAVTSGNAAITTSGFGTLGGVTYLDILRGTNTAGGTTNGTKSIRINPTGGMEWVNSAYNAVILTLTDAGALTAAADVTAYSDARLKENVNTITGALQKVTRLRGVTFNRIDLEDKSEKLGFIAQEVKEVIPQVVLGSEEETYSVAYGNITALHNEAIKEQQIQIEELKAEILELKGIISTLINK